MVKALKVIGVLCLYVTAFTFGGMCGWASNKYCDWCDDLDV